jgi:hypothetical protein
VIRSRAPTRTRARTSLILRERVVALYQGNYLAIIMSLVTGAVHVDLTYGNFAEV